MLAATIEDLVHRDSVDLLELAYKTHDLSTDEPLDRVGADLLIRTFALYFLLPALQKFARSHQQVMAILERRVSRAYPGWHDAMIWVEDLWQGFEYQALSTLRPFTAIAGQQLDFTSMSQWASMISADFGRLSTLSARR